MAYCVVIGQQEKTMGDVIQFRSPVAHGKLYDADADLLANTHIEILQTVLDCSLVEISNNEHLNNRIEGSLKKLYFQLSKH